MKRHWAYLKYVLRHKLFVLVASRKTGCSLWRALLHDWSKFLPSEWLPYAHCFYAPDGSKQYQESPEYATAWLLHQRRNPHHWQTWLLRWDRGETIPLEMPEKYAREMVADWMGAGRAITGKWEVAAWYLKNKDKIQLHVNTRLLVQEILIDWQAEVMK
jgi:hypothetical protein